jgi:hypothetical protein
VFLSGEFDIYINNAGNCTGDRLLEVLYLFDNSKSSLHKLPFSCADAQKVNARPQ